MNADFVYLRPEFVTEFWEELYPGNEDEFDGIYTTAELSKMRKAGEIPVPSTLDFTGLTICSQSSHFGDMGLDCGFTEL